MSNNSEFGGEIVVASRIVDYLSSGLYDKPSACLKELINNSFDADATEVNVFVKPDANRIIIEDNGAGMNRAEFEKHFKKISESHKRDESESTLLGRPIIGKIGIGFIAANEICDVMEIISTKEGSEDLLEVAIQFKLMREDTEKRRRGETDMAKADYIGRVTKTDLKSHFTHVFLKGLRGESRSILAGIEPSKYTSGKVSLYGLSEDSIYKWLIDKQIKTWSEFDAYSRNLLEIGLNVPVGYYKNWFPKDLKDKVYDVEKRVKELDFKLYIDGIPILKPIVYNPPGKSLINRFEYNGESVSAKGYFFAQNKTIRPQELQGLLIRIRNAAIGEFDSTYMNYSLSLNPLLQKWVSGELYVNDKLEDALNIDRRTLRIDHPSYVELQSIVHEHLNDFLKRVRREIYGESTITRRIFKAKAVEKNIEEIVNKGVKEISPQTAMIINTTWKDSSIEQKSQKNILKKYTVAQFYKIVIEVAKDILNKEQFELFIQNLTKRLNQ